MSLIKRFESVWFESNGVVFYVKINGVRVTVALKKTGSGWCFTKILGETGEQFRLTPTQQNQLLNWCAG